MNLSKNLWLSMQENTFSKAGNVLFGSNALTIRVSTSITCLTIVIVMSMCGARARVCSHATKRMYMSVLAVHGNVLEGLSIELECSRLKRRIVATMDL